MKMMNERKRQHPFYVFFSFVTILRHMIIPGILAFLSTAELRSYISTHWIVLFVAIILMLMLVSSLLEWRRFTYRVEDGSLKVEQGIFVKKRRDISRERIQSIDESAGIFHRLFNVVKVTIETAGGQGKPEVVLNTVKKSDADALRRALSKKRDLQENEEQSTDSDEITLDYRSKFKLTTQQLLIAGATSGKIGVVMAAIGGLLSQADRVLPDRFFESIFQEIIESSLAFIGVVLIAAAVIAWFLAMLGAVLKYGGFTLTITEKELRIEHGLLEKRQLTIPVNRVQAVRIEEGILRQPFGLSALYVETGGGGGEDDFSTVLFPLLAKKDVFPFLEKVLPNYAHSCDWQPLPKRALKRYLFRAAIPITVLALITGSFIPWGYWLFTFVPIFAFFGYLAYRDAGWAFSEQRVFLRFRRLSRTTVIVQKRRAQAAETQQSFLQKRARLASFQVSVISSFAGAHFKVRDLEASDGADLLDWLRKA